MEPAEDASLEPAIGWLAQSILASPLIKEQAPWVREAGLAEEMEGLKSEIKGVQLVVSVIKGRALGNEPLSESLVELKELLYDADDAVDELDYWVTQHDLDQTDVHHGESQADRPTENADAPNISGTSHDLEQRDGHNGGLQTDRSIHNADVPSTSGTLHDPTDRSIDPTACANLLLDDGPSTTMLTMSSTFSYGTGTLPSFPSTFIMFPNGVFDPPETDGHGTQPVERSTKNAAAQRRSVGKLRSKLWKEFEILEFDKKNGAPVRAKCIHCDTELGCPTKQGTGVLQNHLNSKACSYDALSITDATTNPAPVATANLLSSKKRRRDEESTHLITANTNWWNKDEFAKMIQDITLKLRHIREGLIPVLSVLGSGVDASSSHIQGPTSHQHRRTSGTFQGRVYGRDSEKNKIIKLIEEKKSSAGVTVLPILGIAGIGKTALAQLVYNDPAVKDQFDHMLWIWISNSFDAMELTKDMLGYVSEETHVPLCNFSKLQEILKSRIKSKRVLLILDDVWDGINDYQWNQLLAPFNSDNARDNMIIVTTRKPCVAKRRGTVTPIKLEALETDDFWSLFKACAFGDVNLEEQDRLSDLGKQIAQKLKGNPLAAETAVALLREHRTVAHWSSILKNEGWKSLALGGGIMLALKLCYDKLPYHLQKCFSYCSLFPCNYEFLAEQLVRIWISQGFVKCNNSSKRLEEIGQDYLADLVNLGFFEQIEKKSSSGCTKTCYVMYDLMHDFARVVSRTECATIDGLECNRMFPAVRHLSIISNSIYQVEDQTGYIARVENFEELLRNSVTLLGKLRSLVLIGHFGSSFCQFIQTAIQKSHNLRLLYLPLISATSADHRSVQTAIEKSHNLRLVRICNTC